MHAPGTALKTYWRDDAISISSIADGYMDLAADIGVRITSAYTLISGYGHVLQIGDASATLDFVASGLAAATATYGGTLKFYSGASGNPVFELYSGSARMYSATPFEFRDATVYVASLNDGYMDIAADIGVRVTSPEFVLQTPVFRDDNFGSSRVTLGATAPTWTTFLDNLGADTLIDCLAFAVGDEVTWTSELQHDYAEGEDIYLHNHYQCDAAPSGTDQGAWMFYYSIVRDGTTMSPMTSIPTGDVAIDTQYEQVIAATAAIDGTSLLIGDQISIRMVRVAAAGDAYAGTLKLKTAGVHYPVNSMGSKTLYAK